MPLYPPPGIAGREVDPTGLSDENAYLHYDETSDTWKVVTSPSLLGRAIVKCDGGMIYTTGGDMLIKVTE